MGRRLASALALLLLAVTPVVWFLARSEGSAAEAVAPAEAGGPSAADGRPPAELAMKRAMGGGAAREAVGLSEPAPEPAPRAVGEPAPGDPESHGLEGLVVDHLGLGVGGVRVLARARGRDAAATTDRHGRFSFSGLPEGRCEVRVEEGSVPAGYLAPLQSTRLEVGRYPEAVPGTFAPVVELPYAHTLVLHLAQPGAVEGTLRFAPEHGGGAAVDCVVRITGQGPSLSGLSYEVAVDAAGAFRIESVFPGAFALSVLQPSGEADHRGRPAPRVFQVHGGSTARLGELLLGAGPVSLRGTLLDQYGAPVEGARVLAYYVDAQGRGSWDRAAAAAVTDVEGGFELVGVEPGLVHVMPLPQLGGPSEPVLRDVQPTLVDLRGREGLLDLGELRVQRAGQYALEGQVWLDADWAAEHGVDLGDVRLFVDGEVPGFHHDARPDLDGEGRFRWTCWTPQAALSLRVEVRGTPLGARYFDIVPSDGAVDRLVVELP